MERDLMGWIVMSMASVPATNTSQETSVTNAWMATKLIQNVMNVTQTSSDIQIANLVPAMKMEART